MLRCIIIDDEPLACEVLQQHIAKIQGLAMQAVFHNAQEALKKLQDSSVDIIFLDIEMPEMSGIDFLRQLKEPPLTVFTTAYRDYAFEGYELGVIDFLLKPVSFERFSQCLQRIQDFILLKEQNSLIQNAEAPSGAFFVKSGVQKVKLLFEEVTHIQGLKDYAIIYHLSGKVVVKGSVKAMHQLFPEQHFIRVHKSFIVAKNKILRVERNSVILKNLRVPVGRTYKEIVEKIFDA